MMSESRENASRVSDSQPAGNAEYLALGEAAEEINRCLAAGTEPDLTALAAGHPGLESQVRQLVETLRALHELGCTTDSGDPGSAISDRAGSVASLLGDYRLVR